MMNMITPKKFICWKCKKIFDSVPEFPSKACVCSQGFFHEVVEVLELYRIIVNKRV